MEANAQARAKEKEKELQRVFHDKERVLQETQMSVAKKLGEAEHKLNTLQSALDSTQSELFDLKAKYDEATSAKSDEMEMIVADLERANERCAAAERENESLRSQLASAAQQPTSPGAQQSTEAANMDQAMDILKRSSLEVELAAKEKEISQLVEEVQKLQSQVNKLRDANSSTIARLEEELAAKSRAFALLEERIKTQDDYEEIKRELNILKSIEFANTNGSSNDDADSGKKKPLEMLLLEKNKALQTENTHLKVSNSELAGSASSAGSSPPVTTSSPSNRGFPPPPVPPLFAGLPPHMPPPPGFLPPPPGPHDMFASLLPHLAAAGGGGSSGDLVSPYHLQSQLAAMHHLHMQQAAAAAALRGANAGTDQKPPSLPLPVVSSSGANGFNPEHFAALQAAALAAAAASVHPGAPRTPQQQQPSPGAGSQHSHSSHRDSNPDLALPHTTSNSSTPVSSNLTPKTPTRGGDNHHHLLHHPTSTATNTPNGLHHGAAADTTNPSSSSSSTSSAQAHLQRIHNAMARSESTTSAQVLDTAEVAARIREILSAHNIGQRLFAKHVLGLSQGTVSELLSKPKHWDKLTEKGRESYRKMHAWSLNENNVLDLKAISPKKGSGGGGGGAPLSGGSASSLAPGGGGGYRQEDSATEERIAQILSEAQQQMASKHATKDTHMANAMVASIYQQELAKMSAEQKFPGGGLSSSPRGTPTSSSASSTSDLLAHAAAGGETRGRKPQTDAGSNLTQEIVSRIYQEELLKLASAAERAGNLAECNMYRAELARIAAGASHRGGNSGAEENKENLMLINNLRLASIKQEAGGDSATRDQGGEDDDDMPQDLRMHATGGGGDSSQDGDEDSLRQSGSAFFLVRPRSNPNSQDLPHFPMNGAGSLEAMSPLQRMQSIANSLMAKSQIQQHSSRPLRAVLPPITQEEFDKYSNINTDDLVKQVKETLSQYSISQRLFGENVLGLSQGSVSDLLARPKPWHMLTQKGREPFIRMKIFLEDGESIPKLVASQYRIPPDKLLRSNSVTDSTGTVSPETIKPHHHHPHHPPASTSAGSRGGSATPAPPTRRSPPAPPHPITSMIAGLTPLPLPPTAAGSHHHLPPHHHPHHHFSPQHHKLPSPRDYHQGTPIPPTTPGSAGGMPDPPSPPNNSSMMPAPPPAPPTSTSMFEVAAMTQELDTLTITTKVKELLQFHNLGQKLFGEAVLGLSQGTISELLSKPKPWPMLSLKGREPFIKMHMWLNDPHNIDRLRVYQSELKANRKRSRSSDERSQDGSASGAPGGGGKKQRVFFTEEQKDTLRLAYASDPYPSPARIEELASQIGVGTKTIVNWFHNHRMRAKQQPGTAGINGGSSGGAGSAAGVKMEVDDSNQSDAQSTSSPSSPMYRSAAAVSDSLVTSAAGSAPIPSVNQWMFPSFEPVVAMAARHHRHRGNSDSPPVAGGDSAQDLSTLSSRGGNESVAKRGGVQDLSFGANEDEDGSSVAGDNKGIRSSSSPTRSVMELDSAAELAELTNAEAEDQSNNNKPAAGFHLLQQHEESGGGRKNRRKSSRPKWVYEGVALENALEDEDEAMIGGNAAAAAASPSNGGVENLEARQHRHPLRGGSDDDEDNASVEERLSRSSAGAGDVVFSGVSSAGGLRLEKSAIDKLPERKVEEWDDRPQGGSNAAPGGTRGNAEGDDDWEF